MNVTIRPAREEDLPAILEIYNEAVLNTTASLRLHAAFGFERVAHLRQVGFKFGRWLDVAYLELLLDGPPPVTR
jgi:phosphinothricin acetyltransferase